jgi:hypothetical protein
VWNVGCSRKTGNASTFILRFFRSSVGRSLAILTVCYLTVRSISRVGCDSGRWNAMSPTRWSRNRGTALRPNICAFGGLSRHRLRRSRSTFNRRSMRASAGSVTPASATTPGATTIFGCCSASVPDASSWQIDRRFTETPYKSNRQPPNAAASAAGEESGAASVSLWALARLLV